MRNSVTPSLYEPLNDPVYMSEQMIEYFKEVLMQMRKEILKKEETILLGLIDVPNHEPDLVDQGVIEEFHNRAIGFQMYEDRVFQEVEAALQRIKNGNYGYCEETSKPIGVRRLLAVPYTRYSIEVQVHKDKIGTFYSGISS